MIFLPQPGHSPYVVGETLKWGSWCLLLIRLAHILKNNLPPTISVVQVNSPSSVSSGSEVVFEYFQWSILSDQSS